MTVPQYEYAVEQCDVPEVRRASLEEYRKFRRKCLEYFRGDADTSVTNQVHDLTWHTAVFRTLNEARRIEPGRAVNGPMWELISAGYANLMTLGIRRLVDTNPKTNSVWNIVCQLERRPELLTREKFVCYDGLPYDYESVLQKYLGSLDLSTEPKFRWLPTRGPDAWATSQRLHEAFDKLAGKPAKRKRADSIQLSILSGLKDWLKHPTIQKVCTMADRRVAHAERLSDNADPVPIATYNDIDEALQIIVRVANFLSSSVFYDAAFGSVVATPQFDVLDSLDAPWISKESLPALHEYWHAISTEMDRWAYDTNKEFLPATELPSSSPDSVLRSAD